MLMIILFLVLVAGLFFGIVHVRSRKLGYQIVGVYLILASCIGLVFYFYGLLMLIK